MINNLFQSENWYTFKFDNFARYIMLGVFSALVSDWPKGHRRKNAHAQQIDDDIEGRAQPNRCQRIATEPPDQHGVGQSQRELRQLRQGEWPRKP